MDAFPDQADNLPDDEMAQMRQEKEQALARAGRPDVLPPFPYRSERLESHSWH